MGIDERDVITEHDVKSVGHEQTFFQDIRDLNLAKKELLSLSSEVGRRMRRKGVSGKTVTLKVKYDDFVQITRATTLPALTDDGFEIYGTACDLLKKTEVGKRPVRLLGVSLSQLVFFGKEGQLNLFDEDDGSQKRKSLNIALDSLYDKFGADSVRPGTLVAKKEKE
jgi:DNA polymerase-4